MADYRDMTSSSLWLSPPDALVDAVLADCSTKTSVVLQLVCRSWRAAVQCAVAEARLLAPGSSSQLANILARLPNLRKLDLSWIEGELSLKDVGALSGLRSLRELHLPGISTHIESSVETASPCGQARDPRQGLGGAHGLDMPHAISGRLAQDSDAAAAGVATTGRSTCTVADLPSCAAEESGPGSSSMARSTQPLGGSTSSAPNKLVIPSRAVRAASAAVAAFYTVLPQLTKLNLEVSPLLPPSQLTCLSGLTALTIDALVSVDPLRQLPRLQSLAVKRLSTPEHLHALRALTHLAIHTDTGYPSEFLSPITTLPALRSLSFRTAAMRGTTRERTAGDRREWAGLTNLQELDLRLPTELLGPCLMALPALRGLTSLVLDTYAGSDAEPSMSLTCPPQLLALTVSADKGMNYGHVELALPASLTSLHLRLYWASVSLMPCTGLPQLPPQRSPSPTPPLPPPPPAPVYALPAGQPLPLLPLPPALPVPRLATLPTGGGAAGRAGTVGLEGLLPAEQMTPASGPLAHPAPGLGSGGRARGTAARSVRPARTPLGGLAHRRLARLQEHGNQLQRHDSDGRGAGSEEGEDMDVDGEKGEEEEEEGEEEGGEEGGHGAGLRAHRVCFGTPTVGMHTRSVGARPWSATQRRTALRGGGEGEGGQGTGGAGSDGARGARSAGLSLLSPLPRQRQQQEEQQQQQEQQERQRQQQQEQQEQEQQQQLLTQEEEEELMALPLEQSPDLPGPSRFGAQATPWRRTRRAASGGAPPAAEGAGPAPPGPRGLMPGFTRELRTGLTSTGRHGRGLASPAAAGEPGEPVQHSDDGQDPFLPPPPAFRLPTPSPRRRASQPQPQPQPRPLLPGPAQLPVVDELRTGAQAHQQCPPPIATRPRSVAMRNRSDAYTSWRQSALPVRPTGSQCAGASPPHVTEEVQPAATQRLPGRLPSLIHTAARSVFAAAAKAAAAAGSMLQRRPRPHPTTEATSADVADVREKVWEAGESSLPALPALQGPGEEGEGSQTWGYGPPTEGEEEEEDGGGEGEEGAGVGVSETMGPLAAAGLSLHTLTLDSCFTLCYADMVAMLRGLPLQTLHVRDALLMDDNDVCALTSLTRLSSLSLSGCHLVTDHGLSTLARLPRLDSLRVKGLHRLDTAAVQAYTAVRSLSRSSAAINGAFLTAFRTRRSAPAAGGGRGGCLRTLALSHLPLLDEGRLLAGLRALPSLTSLNVKAVPGMCDGVMVRGVSHLPHLQRATITHCRRVTSTGRAAVLAAFGPRFVLETEGCSVPDHTRAVVEHRDSSVAGRMDGTPLVYEPPPNAPSGAEASAGPRGGAGVAGSPEAVGATKGGAGALGPGGAGAGHVAAGAEAGAGAGRGGGASAARQGFGGLGILGLRRQREGGGLGDEGGGEESGGDDARPFKRVQRFKLPLRLLGLGPSRGAPPPAADTQTHTAAGAAVAAPALVVGGAAGLQREGDTGVEEGAGGQAEGGLPLQGLSQEGDAQLVTSEQLGDEAEESESESSDEDGRWDEWFAAT